MELRDKVSELPPEKVVAYVKRQLSLGKIQPVLGLFPEILESHADYAEALEQIHQRALKKEAMLAETQPTELDVSQTTCPGCGAVLHRARPDAQAIACSYCGTRFMPADPAGTAVKTLNPEHYRPRSFLRLGMVGRMGEHPCQVVGRMVWSGRCREWDSEDRSWESNPWTYEEWLLLTENRQFFYLCHDDEGLSVATEFTPSQPNFPGRQDRKMTLEAGRQRTVDEHGEYDLRYFEGEFGWVPQVGEPIATSEYSSGKALLSAEARLHPESREIVELEFFRTIPYTPKRLFRAFDRDQELAELVRRKHVAGQYRRWRWASFATATLLGILAIVLGGAGDPVYSETYDFSAFGEDGIVAGPFELSKAGRPHRLALSASIGDNSWAWIGAELLDTERNSINAMAGDFWRESGYDDGHWSESDVREEQHFRLTEPGRYFVRMQLEAGTAGTGRVSLQVYENTILGRYYVVSAVIALVLGLLLLRGVRTDDLLRGLPTTA
ncbi:MAG: hypothetical protein AAGE01_03370 [Pseudomonadota bacterium]